MILDSLTLENFRQFYSTQEIKFSKDSKQNVTVIHGENGSGKTTILNALSWVLYGRVTFEKPEKLLNERLIAEAPVGKRLETSCTLKFEHDKRHYSVKRTLSYRKENPQKISKMGDSILDVDYIENDGRTKTPGNPQNTLNQILPPEMMDYFFFHGEKIDRLSSDESADEINRAIKNIMGLEILERSLKHLDQSLRELRKEQKATASELVKSLIEEEGEIESKLEELNGESGTLSDNKKSLITQIGEISDRLRNLEKAKAYQERYDKYKNELTGKEDELKLKLDEIKDLITTKGYLAFIQPAILGANNFLEEKRKIGELPSGIKEQFIDDLLENGECICGTDLKEGSAAHQKLIKWKSEKAAVSRELDDAYIRTSGQLAVLLEQRENLFKELNRLMGEKSSISDRIQTLEENIDDINAMLLKGAEEIPILTKKRKDLEANKEETTRKIGWKEKEISNKETELTIKRKEIEDAEHQGKKELLSQRRYNSCLKARELIQAIYEGYTSKTREEVEREVGRIYSETIRKQYWAEITPDYKLKILKKVNGRTISVGMSDGERKVASLCFIGGLVNIARKQNKMKSDIFFEGGIYPIVMDSPFSNLDPVHREKVSSGIPRLADQVVVLVSDSQWIGNIEAQMKPRIGSEYTLKYHEPGPGINYEATEVVKVS